MQVKATPLSGLVIIEPAVHRDSRGFFIETWRESWAKEIGAVAPFIQDNHAYSTQPGVVRGLHFQAPPAAQSKLIWVTRGAIFDVAVDLRTNSPTFGKWFGLEISAGNFLRLYVPKGFAHGYMTTQPDTEVQYKVDAFYSPEHEGGLLWNDPGIGVAWPNAEASIVSPKDATLPGLASFSSPFSAV